MRIMAKVTIPVEAGNDGIRNGNLPKVMQRTAERWNPESVYFTADAGQRTAFMVVDLADSSEIPPFAEPFFTELKAEVELMPAMNMDDLQKGLAKLD